MNNILKRLSSLFASPRAPTEVIAVRCQRCGEIITTRVNLSADLSPEYDGDELTYFCHKTLIGPGPCFQRVEVELTYDHNHRLVNCQVQGGERVAAQ